MSNKLEPEAQDKNIKEEAKAPTHGSKKFKGKMGGKPALTKEEID